MVLMHNLNGLDKGSQRITRHFTQEGEDPYETVSWELRDARLTNYADGYENASR